MYSAILEAYISSAWVDITNYTLKLGDFYQIYNNYDTSLRDVDLAFTLSSTILNTYSTLGLGYGCRVKQDDKIIFVGTINKFEKEDKYNYIIECSLISVVEKMKAKIIESVYKTGIEANTTVTTGIALDGYTYNNSTNPPTMEIKSGIFKGYDPTELIEYIFEVLTGYELDASSASTWIMDGEVILAEMFWNIGSEKVSANAEYRDTDKLWTWYDFLNLLCIGMNTLTWDCTNEKFILSHVVGVGETGNPDRMIDKPDTIDTWKYDKESLTMTRNMIFSYKWCTNFPAYFRTTVIPDPQTDSYNWKVDKETPINGSITDAPENISYEPPTNLIFYRELSFGMIFPFAGLERFRYTYRNEKYLINFKEDVLNPDGDCYANLVDCEAVNNGGRYFSLMELSERDI